MPLRHCIVPPYLLQALEHDSDDRVAASARASLLSDEQIRAQRRPPAGIRPSAGAAASESGSGPERVISDAGGREVTPGTRARGEGDPATGDTQVDQAYDGLGDTWAFWKEAYGRDSLDGHGLPLLGTVHYGRSYDNAFWDGTQMVFGDGDGTIFNAFTSSLDVIGHELAHGVTSATANLRYQGQSGALNESMSDVFGALVQQHKQGQSAGDATWLIGADLLTAGVSGRALRDMLNPGTAYDDPRLGKDPQPADMDGYVVTGDDNGGVHINSGIPNRAFALAANAIGGHAWAKAGQVWWDVLSGPTLTAGSDFVTFAKLTVEAATARFGEESDEAGAIRTAWHEVGVLTPTGRAAARANRAAEATAAALTDPPAGPSGATSLAVTRTGGFGGTTMRRQVTLAELPDRQRQAWVRLLSTRELTDLPAASERADSFCYRVSSPQLGYETTVAETHLPDPVRSLIESTLRRR